jgi:hypothetical protein
MCGMFTIMHIVVSHKVNREQRVNSLTSRIERPLLGFTENRL